MKTENWITKQRKKAEKIFSPKIDYDEEHDILYITWLPHLNCYESIEAGSDFIFDISKEPASQIKGIEIFNFMKKIKKEDKK